MRMMTLSAVGLLMACGGKTVIVEDHYYSLVLEAAADREVPARSSTEGLVILTEVVLPDFLMLRNLTLQTSSNEIDIAKHHHWADPLDESVQKVLIWDLSAQLPALDITRSAVADADCTLAVEFDRLHADSSGHVLASGRYTLTRNEHSTRHEFDVSQPLRADGYTAAVTGIRQALAALGEAMRPQVQGCVVQALRAAGQIQVPASRRAHAEPDASSR